MARPIAAFVLLATLTIMVGIGTTPPWKLDRTSGGYAVSVEQPLPEAFMELASKIIGNGFLSTPSESDNDATGAPSRARDGEIA